MSSELAGNFSFFLSSLVRSTDWKGRCVYLVCRLISFFTDTHQMQNLSGTLKVNFTPPLFSFLVHNLIWGYLIPMCLGIFILISFTRTLSLEIPLWFSFFPLENCIYQSGCSWWYWQLCCINDLLLNWISRLQQQNLNCFFPRFDWSFKESVVCAIKWNWWRPQTWNLWDGWSCQLTGLTGKICAWSVF